MLEVALRSLVATHFIAIAKNRRTVSGEMALRGARKLRPRAPTEFLGFRVANLSGFVKPDSIPADVTQVKRPGFTQSPVAPDE